MSRMIALLIVFLDNLGIGLVFTMLPPLIYDPSFTFLFLEVSTTMRSILLGLLLAIMPLGQFITAPIWGSISDNIGRKKPLTISLCCATIGYCISLLAISSRNLDILLLSRAIVGVSAGNMSTVQAVLADVSTDKTRITNFGFFSMALGGGFAIGPFFGALLSTQGHYFPFLFGLGFTVTALILMFFFKETNLAPTAKKIQLSQSFLTFQKAFYMKKIRPLFLCSFIHNFGWSFFYGLSPIYLISEYGFRPMHLTIFYGVVGAMYAFSAGVLIRAFTKRIKASVLLFLGLGLTGTSFLLIPILPSIYLLWPLIIFVSYVVAFVAPSYTTIISDKSSPEMQGETLGVLSSVNALALVCSLFCGSLVGTYPTSAFWVAGICNLLAAAIIPLFFTSKDFFKKMFQPRQKA
jgi:DHA1 family tetracycline resistance protein-like MFS transporter